MFPSKHKITAVTSTGIKTTKDGGTSLTASSLAGVGGGSSVSVATYTNSQYSYYMSGLLPATPEIPDSSSLAYFYRDIYLHDSVAGSCVDIQSIFPFSDWELRGLEEKELHVYNTALDRLNLKELLPQVSTAYLTDGYYAGSLVYDSKQKNFMDILTHDALSCAVSPSPFNNIDPAVRVTVSGQVQNFLDSGGAYAKYYMDSMPRQFVDLLRQGSFALEPAATIFLGRRALTDRAYVSYLHRILPMYLIEKAMYRGTLIEANRRQRAMSHIQAGDDLWTPTSEELMSLVQQFQSAEQDPLGGWITTRNAVQVSDLRPAGDFWKWTDMVDVMVQYKLRALGISEALLSGDASFAAAESAYSTFLETMSSYRGQLTNAIFNKKLFPLIAATNGLVKDRAELKRTSKDMNTLLANKHNLRMPTMHWHKDLTAKLEDNMMDMLEKVKEITGMNVPLKTWLAAAGVDKDTLIRDAREDEELRKALNMAGEPPEGGDSDEFTGASTAMPKPLHSGLKNRIPLLSRKFQDGELYTQSPTGKKRLVVNQEAKQRDIHARIAKIAARMESDAAYRHEVKARNLEKFGKTTLNV